MGELPRDQVLAILSAADTFLNTSTSEGSPNALLEALAGGLACVATNVEGNTDSEGAAAIIYTPPRDPEAIANVLLRLMHDDSFRLATGRASRGAVTMSGWDGVAKQYEEAFLRAQSLVRNPRSVA
jgi:glycosyltransferase involved in cell wall biosynthesis